MAERFYKEHPMLASFKQPRYYRFIEVLDMTATGKKIHYKIKQKAKEDISEGLIEKTSAN